MFLSAGDALPRQPDRVLVAGPSGAGKTTLAAHVAHVLEIPHIEIDALFHGPRWSPRPRFIADVAAFSARSQWATEWQYEGARRLLADRADLVVWLDLPRAVVLGQVSARTLRRWWRREVLWNGNREPSPWRGLYDPEHVVRWAWRTYPASARQVWALARRRPDLPVVRLTTRREVRGWIVGPLPQSIEA